MDRVAAGRLILAGDAAHMASPRTTVGAHTGVLDAAALRDAFTAHPGDVDAAIRAYSPGGAERARELYLRSLEASRPFRYAPENDRRR